LADRPNQVLDIPRFHPQAQCCVHSTLRDAVDRGFRCLTLADGSAAFDPVLHEAVLAIIQGENHLFGWIADTSTLCSALEAGSA
jgi:nicotinamidase-related amidase